MGAAVKPKTKRIRMWGVFNFDTLKCVAYTRRAARQMAFDDLSSDADKYFLSGAFIVCPVTVEYKAPKRRK